MKNSFLILIAHRLGYFLVAFFIASLALFSARVSMPGDPVSLRLKNPDPERVKEIRAYLGLDDPLPVQYFNYIGNFATGDWGESLISSRPISDELMERFPATLELTLCALFLGTLVGLATAFGAQLLHWRALKFLSQALGAAGLTVPIFWIGLILMAIFGYQLNWFPISGRFDFGERPEITGFLILDSLITGNFEALGTALRYLTLPTLCLAMYPAALISGLLLARFEDPRLLALVRALQAKGLSPARIWLRHVLKLLGAPIITVIGTNFAGLLGGAVLTETIFSWPGMGQYLVSALLNSNIYVMENGLLFVVLLALLVITLADIIAQRVNPALRHA